MREDKERILKEKNDQILNQEKQNNDELMSLLQQIRQLENVRKESVVEIESLKRHKATKRSKPITPSNPLELPISRVDVPMTNRVNLDGLCITKLTAEFNTYGIFSLEFEMSDGTSMKAGDKPGSKTDTYEVGEIASIDIFVHVQERLI